MKKATKRKRPSSLSNNAVDTINLNPNDPDVQAAKAKDDQAKAALALSDHALFEEKAEAFASEFRTINAEAQEVKTRLVSVTITAKAFIEGNRDFLKKVLKFFASNKGRKVKQSLNGHFTVEAWSLDRLGVCDDYVRKVFRATDKAFTFEDGVKLLPAAVEIEEVEEVEGGDEGDTPPTPPVSFRTFANHLQMSAIKEIHESAYPEKFKLKITTIVMTGFQNYAAELKLSLDAIPVNATEEEAGTAQGAAA